MCGRPLHWAHQQFLRLRLAQRAVAASSMLEFSSALCAKLVGDWIGGAAGTGRAWQGRSGFAFARRYFAAYESVEIGRRFNILDLLKDHCRFRAHFAADLLIVLFRKLSALVFEIEILNVAEDDFLLSLK